MQLPFPVAAEMPSRARLRRAARNPWVWIAVIALLVCTAAALAAYVYFRRTEAGGVAALRVTSDPGDTSVQVGGRTLGRTPIEVRLAAGEHRITFHRDGYADAIRAISLESGGRADLHADLWLWTPRAQLLRPTCPGATIAGTTFLADGRVALTVALPPDDERQTWLLDHDGGTRRLGPTEARGPLAVAPDGGRVAYTARGQDGEST